MYETRPKKKLSARMRKSAGWAQNIMQRNIINFPTTSQIMELNLLTIITTVVGLPGIMYYKDNGLYIFRLIHIYIYFNILLSYLNAAHSAVLLSRMIRC